MKIKKEKWEEFKKNYKDLGYIYIEGSVPAFNKYVKILNDTDYIAIYENGGMERELHFCRVGVSKYLAIVDRLISDIKSFVEA